MIEEKKKEKDSFLKKLEKLYHNYGIDISDIDEDELERLKKSYLSPGKNIDNDIKESEVYKEKFSEEEMI